jgi:flavin-binding protein dodecin
MAKNKNEKDRVYKKIGLVGTSSKSFESAIESAVQRAGQTLRGLRWFEVKELRGAIRDNGKIEYQAVVSVSFEIK